MSNRWAVAARRARAMFAGLFGLGMVVVIIAFWTVLAMYFLHPSIGRHFVPIRGASNLTARG